MTKSVTQESVYLCIKAARSLSQLKPYICIAIALMCVEHPITQHFLSYHGAMHAVFHHPSTYS